MRLAPPKSYICKKRDNGNLNFKVYMIKTNNKAGGRPPKIDKAKNCLTINFTDTEYVEFLSMWERSAVESKATFIKARVFGESFRVTTVDKTMMIYEQRLSSFYNQYRAIGVNYNQTVATLKSNFEVNKALAMLYKLEQHTLNLVTLSQNIINLSKEFKSLWSQKYGLHTAEKQSKTQKSELQYVDISKGDVKQQVETALREVNKRYHFMSFAEYKAVLLS